MESYFLKTNFSLSHLLISIIISIFHFVRCFIDILRKYKFHDERGFFVNKDYVTKFLSDGKYFKTAKGKLIITKQLFPLEVNLNSVTAEDSNIENTILFGDNL